MRLRVLLLVVALAALASGCGDGEEDILEVMTPEGTPGAPSGPPPGAMLEAEGESSVLAVDAVPGDPVDAARTVSGDAPFDVDIVVVEASSPYKAVQFKLKWDPAVLSYVEQEYHEPIELGFCQLPSIEDGGIYGGCAGQVGTLFIGAMATLKLQCVASGTSPLHLVTFDDDRNFGTGLAFNPGVAFPWTLQDASVTCE